MASEIEKLGLALGINHPWQVNAASLKDDGIHVDVSLASTRKGWLSRLISANDSVEVKTSKWQHIKLGFLPTFLNVEYPTSTFTQQDRPEFMGDEGSLISDTLRRMIVQVSKESISDESSQQFFGLSKQDVLGILAERSSDATNNQLPEVTHPIWVKLIESGDISKITKRVDLKMLHRQLRAAVYQSEDKAAERLKASGKLYEFFKKNESMLGRELVELGLKEDSQRNKRTSLKVTLPSFKDEYWDLLLSKKIELTIISGGTSFSMFLNKLSTDYLAASPNSPERVQIKKTLLTKFHNQKFKLKNEMFAIFIDSMLRRDTKTLVDIAGKREFWPETTLAKLLKKSDVPPIRAFYPDFRESYFSIVNRFNSGVSAERDLAISDFIKLIKTSAIKYPDVCSQLVQINLQERKKGNNT